MKGISEKRPLISFYHDARVGGERLYRCIYIEDLSFFCQQRISESAKTTSTSWMSSFSDSLLDQQYYNRNLYSWAQVIIPVRGSTLRHRSLSQPTLIKRYSSLPLAPLPSSLPPLTHEVGHYLAHGGPEDEVLEDAGDEGEGHAEDGHHQVTDGERQQEGVGDGSHALVDRQHHDDQQVAEHAQEEDEGVEQDPQRVVIIWEEDRRKRG